MARNKIKSILVERLEKSCRAYHERETAMRKKLEEEREGLNQAFGKEIVDAVLRELAGEKAAVQSSATKSVKVVSSTAVSDKKSSVPVRRRRRRKSARQGNQLNFSEVRNRVLDAVKMLPPNSQITAADMSAAVSRGGLRVDRNHVSLVLSKGLGGLQKLAPVTNPKTGRQMNSYLVPQPAAVVLQNANPSK